MGGRPAARMVFEGRAPDASGCLRMPPDASGCLRMPSGVCVAGQFGAFQVCRMRWPAAWGREGWLAAWVRADSARRSGAAGGAFQGRCAPQIRSAGIRVSAAPCTFNGSVRAPFLPLNACHNERIGHIHY